jgi:choline dehydrogenase-like flavoprotein
VANSHAHSVLNFSPVANPPPDRVYTEEEGRSLYFANRTGPWTSFGPVAFTFAALPSFSNRSAQLMQSLLAQSPQAYLRPGAHATVVAGWDAQKKILAKYLATKKMAITEFLPNPAGVFAQQHPFSRGYIEIKSNDPFTYPTLDFRYGSNPLDFDVLVDSLRFLRRLGQTAELQAMGYAEVAPGPNVTTDADIKQYIASQMSTFAHSCCTNPMQPRNLGGVVDAKLKVYGTTNLRYEYPFGLKGDTYLWLVIESPIRASCL